MFCIPLLSGIVGMLQSKYLPTGDIIAGDLRLELTLAEAVTGVVAVGAVPRYTVSDLELMLEYTDLSSDAARMVSQSNSGGYMISFDSFVVFASSQESGAVGMKSSFRRAIAASRPYSPLYARPIRSLPT
jgi:hypothetical protein